MLGTTILGALTPLAASYNIWCLFALRVAQGVMEGVTFPCLNPMTARWAPEPERSRFMSFAYMGGTVGTVITYPIGGLILAATTWDYVFYATTGFAAVWCVAWFMFVHDLPEDHPRISEEEKQMIIATRSFDPVTRSKELNTPLLPLIWDMIRTPAVVVDMVTDHCSGWGNIMVISMSPTFMKDVLGFDITQNGVLSMLPHLCRAVIGQVSGLLSDIGIKYGVPRLRLQKVFLVLSYMVPGICLVAMSQLSSPSLKYWCVAAMTLGYGFNGTSYSGHYANIISIGPNRSGTTFGMVNMAGNLPGFLMPLVITAFTTGHEDSSVHWGYAFWVFAGLYGLGTIVFVSLAQIDIQPFNYKDYSSKEETEEKSCPRLPSYRTLECKF